MASHAVKKISYGQYNIIIMVAAIIILAIFSFIRRTSKKNKKIIIIIEIIILIAAGVAINKYVKENANKDKTEIISTISK